LRKGDVMEIVVTIKGHFKSVEESYLTAFSTVLREEFLKLRVFLPGDEVRVLYVTGEPELFQANVHYFDNQGGKDQKIIEAMNAEVGMIVSEQLQRLVCLPVKMSYEYSKVAKPGASEAQGYA
jgi:hypothetical protein